MTVVHEPSVIKPSQFQCNKQMTKKDFEFLTCVPMSTQERYLINYLALLVVEINTLALGRIKFRVQTKILRYQYIILLD